MIDVVPGVAFAGPEQENDPVDGGVGGEHTVVLVVSFVTVSGLPRREAGRRDGDRSAHGTRRVAREPAPSG